MSSNGYPWSSSVCPDLATKQYLPSWNAPKLPEYLALANGIAGGSSCVSSEISPRSCLELALSVGRHSPCILPPTNPSMNERTGASYSFTNPVLDPNQQPNPRVSMKSAMQSKETPICFDFVQGKCRRQNCKYQHDFGAVIRHNSRESRICFDHLRGECTRGSLCRFSHNLKPLIMQSLEDSARPVVEPRANGICYDFCRGACPRGGGCPWTHNLIEIAWSTAKQPLHDQQKITILKKVLNVVLTTCPHSISEAETLQLLQQSISKIAPNTHSKTQITSPLNPAPLPPQLMPNSAPFFNTLRGGMPVSVPGRFEVESTSKSRDMKLPRASPAVLEDSKGFFLLQSLDKDLTNGLDFKLQ